MVVGWIAIAAGCGADAGSAIRVAVDGAPTVTIQVGPTVAAAGDPRFHGDAARYRGEEDPWRWTEDQRIAAAAHDLADLVARIACDGRCAVPVQGAGADAAGPDPRDDRAVIRVGLPSDFGLPSPFASVGPFTREQHRRSLGPRGVDLLGAAAAGVEDAVWDLARDLGYRWYLPTPAWEIVPRAPNLVIPRPDRRDRAAATDRPGFLVRRLVGGPRSGPEALDAQRWATRNGFYGSFEAQAVQGQYGAAYDAVDQATGWFRANPEAVSASSRPAGPWDRTDPVKFCPGYTDAGGVTVADQLATWWATPLLTADPPIRDVRLSRDVLPLHHGDHAYWAGCDPRWAGGPTPADRAVALANGVAERVHPALDGRMISVYAYREVFPGPVATRVDPDLFVWLVGGGYLGTPLDDAIATWRGAGATRLGWYGYWLATPWELPGDDTPWTTVADTARRWDGLLDAGFVVACAGGGGIPRVAATDPAGRRVLAGVQAVIDKDLTAAVLARDLAVDVLVIATDVEHAVIGWGTPAARPLTAVTPAELRGHLAAGAFPGGSMGP
ncbi:MAG: hypothetical protein ABMB14_28735, partial [Myxococcota bacterium]